MNLARQSFLSSIFYSVAFTGVRSPGLWCNQSSTLYFENADPEKLISLYTAYEFT